MRKVLIVAALVSLVGATLVEARPGGRFRERMAKRFEEKAASPAPGATTVVYGQDALQVLDVWQGVTIDIAPKPAAPLVVFVHGGGWKRGSKDNATGQAKPAHFTHEGYAFASINYRLVPDATVEQQAADVAAAVAALRARAGELRIDPDRIVLMGHSAGAHLVALVGTDPQYLDAAGVPRGAIRGVVPIDGAAYDVAAQMADAGRFMADTYRQAFGTDPARQRALSPTLQAGGWDAPRFLLLHVQREDGVAQARGLDAALTKAGAAVEDGSYPGTGLKGHAEINRRLGEADYPATAQVDRWLAAAFSP
jgi:acetyl esterase/lipase